MINKIFLYKNTARGGLHQIAFAAKDLPAAQKDLESRGIQFIASSEQKGIGQYLFNFALPNIAGINVELIHDPALDWPGTER